METFSLIPSLSAYSDGYVWLLHAAVFALGAILCGVLAWLDVRNAIAHGYHVKSTTLDADVSPREPLPTVTPAEVWGYRKVA